MATVRLSTEMLGALAAFIATEGNQPRAGLALFG